MVAIITLNWAHVASYICVARELEYLIDHMNTDHDTGEPNWLAMLS